MKTEEATESVLVFEKVREVITYLEERANDPIEKSLWFCGEALLYLNLESEDGERQKLNLERMRGIYSLLKSLEGKTVKSVKIVHPPEDRWQKIISFEVETAQP